MLRAIVVVACLLVTLPYAGQLRAEDEDTSSSAYLVFDPDTGEFITVNDPNRTNQHAVIDESIESVAADAGTGTAGKLMIGILIVAALLFGAAMRWRRRNQAA